MARIAPAPACAPAPDAEVEVKYEKARRLSHTFEGVHARTLAPETQHNSKGEPRPVMPSDEWSPQRRTCLHTRPWNWLWCALGYRPKRACWGARPYDIGCFVKKRLHWYDVVEDEHAGGHHGHGHHHVDTWWNLPWYKTPEVRQMWGESQEHMHAGGQELFLDLIFVGVAYRVGVVMKAAFYACDHTISPYSAAAFERDGSGSGSGSGSSAGSASSSYAASSASGSAGSVSSSSSSMGRRLGGSDDYPVCMGFGHGLAYALAPFVCMYMLWHLETVYKANYRTRSRIHYLLDLLTSLFLVVAAMSVDTIDSYRGVDSKAPSLILGLLIADFSIWMVRIGEVALASPYEAARRQSAGDLIVGCQVLLCWMAGWMLFVYAFDDALTDARACDGAIALMWLGALRWTWGLFERPLRGLLLPGPHLIVERNYVVSNMGFMYHRNNEFMFLMLGETVLQIVVASAARGSHASDDVLALTKVVAATSFIIAICMMFTFRSMVAGQISGYEATNVRIEADTKEETRLVDNVLNASDIRGGGPKLMALVKQTRARDALVNLHSEAANVEGLAQPLLLRAKVWNALQQMLWQTMAIAIMLIGVGVKLAIYDPLAEGTAHFALAQRLMVGVSMTVVFAIQLFNTMVVKNRQHYRRPLALAKRQPLHCVVVALQLVVLVGQSTASLASTQPYLFFCVQAALGVVQCILLHIQEHKLRVHGTAAHPLSRVPECLDSLRLKATRTRVMNTTEALKATLKIQAIHRGKLSRREMTRKVGTSK